MNRMFAQEAAFLKAHEQLEHLMEDVRAGADSARQIHDVEEKIWVGLRQLGLALLDGFVNRFDTGDVGPAIEHRGRTLRRLEETHNRRYVSVFGELAIERTVYGSRPTQKHEIVPLDSIIGLPDSEVSPLLQDWSQSFCVQGSYASGRETIERILGIRLSVRTLEHMNRQMSEAVANFHETLPMPARAEEGSILVVTADGKGVPMRRESSGPTSKDRKRRRKGEKANKMREACVGAAYTIDRFIRTPQDIVDDAFRRERSKERPTPCHKRLRAELTRQTNGQEIKGKDRTFRWLAEEVAQRRARGQPLVCIMDAGAGMHRMQQEYLPDAVCILDIWHATERLWQAAHCFHREGSREASHFVEQRLLRVLEGDVGRVVGGLRQMATKQGLRGSRLTQLRKAVGYLDNHRAYMKYDEYLAAGFPIGSGVVEGACRHLVKDRMEGTGMRWRISGAQAMLHLRAVWLNGDWDDFQRHRRRAEHRTLYPHRRLVQRLWNHAA